jgi:sterol desaturase/sphingolipid hydroxylase (fatty acid hydroxylase superfamily)
MTAQLLGIVAGRVGEVVLAILPSALIYAAIFTLLAMVSRFACNPGKTWWRSRGLVTDLCYWIVTALFLPYMRVGVLGAVAILLTRITDPNELATYITQGRGPFGGLGFWTQVALYLLLSDLMLYWAHRIFHRPRMWPYHAIHHSAEDVDWTTSFRSHPINVLLGPLLVDAVMLCLGIAPATLAFVAPFNNVTAAFVHANLNWTLGPLKYVVATPVFHRWHHTMPEEGGEKNFAPTFSFWDVLFGTFYMPKGSLPRSYGVDDPNFPQGFAGQILYPFRRRPAAAGSSAKATPT